MTPKSKTKRPAERTAAKAGAAATRPARPQARPAAAATRRPPAPTRSAPKAALKVAPKVAPKAATKPAVEKNVSVKAAPKAAPRPGKGPVVRKVVERPEAARVVAKIQPIAAAKPPSAKTRSKEHAEALAEFGAKDYIVYPTHGVGFIQAVERQEIAGMHVKLFVITFEKDKMTLRVPVSKAKHVGMRKLSTPKIMDSALATLKGRARVKRTMWSRRAQEYEAKINSGNPVSIAEVIRDLHRSANQPDQSYSERQIYEAALERLARELAAVEKIDEAAATERLEKVLRAA